MHRRMVWLLVALFISAGLNGCETQTATPTPTAAGPGAREAAQSDIPLPAGARQVMAAPAMTSYLADELTVAQAADYFRRELPARGYAWDEENSGMGGDDAFLVFSGEDGSITIMVKSEQRGVRILVNMAPQ